MWTRRFALLAWAAALPTGLSAEAPLSAIDWLTRSVATPAPEGAGDLAGVGPDGGIETEAISVTSLDRPRLDALGLLPAARSGLPAGFWGASDGAELAAELAALDPETLPALQDLILTLLVTEFDPPAGGAADGALFLARIDKLVAFGALDPALALISGVGADRPDLFRRWFDIALLTGDEDAACTALRAQPALHPDYAARIYCTARGGDWPAAALTLRSAQALEMVSEAEEALLERFLDPEAFEDVAGEPPPPRPSPLAWRMLEALGEAPATHGLPVAFAQADLRSTSGWKAQIEAAERLMRRGAISANRLLGLYTERRPAASGGVWDRVAAVQALDRALTEGTAEAVSAALPPAWQAMAQADLDVALADLYAERLLRLTLEEPAAEIALRAGLLSRDFATLADTPPLQAATGRYGFLAALARGENGIDRQLLGPAARAVLDGMTRPPPDTAAALLDGGETGAAVLQAIAALQVGAAGDPLRVTEGLAALQAAGLESHARRIALQLMLLDRRG